MTAPVLTKLALNRATLARQLLTARATLSPLETVERLAGMQAQTTNAPYIGLWTRLGQDYRRADLTDLMEQRQVVRATLMRSTLHLMTATDYVQLRLALQPALTRALGAFFGARAKGLPIEKLVAVAREYVAATPRTFTEIKTKLLEIEPERDPEALAYVVRSHLPLVQVPPGGTWGVGGSPAHMLAEDWLGQPLQPAEAGFPALVRRYLAAFGPASLRDLQTWSGLTRLNEPLAALKGELRLFRDEQGNELFDLSDLPLPPADLPAPPRFLPEYDNLLLSHADRTRVIPDQYRTLVFLPAGRVRATFLIDGIVAGTWKTTRAGDTATLVIEPFVTLPPAVNQALSEEGERLLRFIEDKATSYQLQFASYNP